MLLVGGTGGDIDADQANNVARAVKERVEPVGDPAQCAGPVSYNQLGQGSYQGQAHQAHVINRLSSAWRKYER